MQTHETLTVTAEGVTASGIVWARFRQPMPGLVEQMLDLNKGMCQAVEIPVGSRIIIPIPEPVSEDAVLGRISLW